METPDIGAQLSLWESQAIRILKETYAYEDIDIDESRQFPEWNPTPLRHWINGEAVSREAFLEAVERQDGSELQITQDPLGSEEAYLRKILSMIQALRDFAQSSDIPAVAEQSVAIAQFVIEHHLRR